VTRPVAAAPSGPAEPDDDPPAASVTVYPDGPLVLRGDFALRAVDGQEMETPGRTVALCRCGRSAVKPFCDGTHKRSRAVGAAAERSSRPV
jgi:CDGSH-type Zn-finger protein